MSPNEINLREIAIEHARSLGLAAVEVSSFEIEYKGFWIFRRPQWTLLQLKTDSGIVHATFRGNPGTFHSFILAPANKEVDLFPLWIAFPTFSSVTMGWRQGLGKDYFYNWHTWWDGLSKPRRRDYMVRYPEPLDSEREASAGGWKDFYKYFVSKS